MLKATMPKMPQRPASQRAVHREHSAQKVNTQRARSVAGRVELAHGGTRSAARRNESANGEMKAQEGAITAHGGAKAYGEANAQGEATTAHGGAKAYG